MTENRFNPELYQITTNYDWCVKAFRTTKKLLKLNIKLHDDLHQPCRETIRQSDIFLFNHFARFETFIPQYLIHEETGDYCRSIASAEFFGDDRFASFLRSIGVVPNNLPHLFPFLAKEILHGRKIIVFPEGGMVKDKRVVDDKGHFGIFSRSALQRRKHHRGAAVIALALDTFKTALLSDYSRGNYKNIERWAEQLEFDDTESLLIKALKPTTIAPSFITFYPIRVNDNILHQAAKLFRKKINKRFAEELIIEGNLLFKHTDMDIRFGKPLVIGKYWKWWEKQLLPNVVHSFESLNELFELTPSEGHWGGRIHSMGMKAKSSLVRDDYMRSMYQAVTINLSHIASYIIMQCYRTGSVRIACQQFHKMLYLSIKQLQKHDYHLHRSLLNPQEYGAVIDGGSSRLQQYLTTIQSMDLLTIRQNEDGEDEYHLEGKLLDEFHFDEVRMENLIVVYANEISPLKGVTSQITKVFKQVEQVKQQEIANLRFEDQLLAYEWDKAYYLKPRYDEINRQQTFTEDPNWFFLHSEKKQAAAVVLVHGFLASPAELRPFGERLHAQGYHVIGVRLKGHGTSPWDLRDRNWQDWAASVQRGFNIVKTFSDEVHLVGFSTGGLLALNHAVQHPDIALTSVVSINAPVSFQNKNMRFVPLLHHANKIVRWVSSEGLIPFRPNDTEHPDINYSHIPIRALYQLQKLVEHFFQHPAPVGCPVHLMQADNDPVVEPDSVNRLYQHLLTDHKQIETIHSAHHGIVFDDIDQTQQKIIDWLDNQPTDTVLALEQQPA